MKVTLYRGLRIDKDKVDEVISQIKTQGLRGEEGLWRFYAHNLRKHIKKLFNKPDLSLDDIYDLKKGKEFQVIAFADKLGAHYYAIKHGRSNDQVPVVIRAEIDLDKKYVTLDGRDFLYCVFALWDRSISKTSDIQETYRIVRSILTEIYGKKICKYFDKAAKSNDSDYRCAICELAVHDLEVVKEHLKNRIVIRGRYGVIFRSAFFVETPITPNEVKEVFIPKISEFKHKFRPDICFTDLLPSSSKEVTRLTRIWEILQEVVLEKTFDEQ